MGTLRSHETIAHHARALSSGRGALAITGVWLVIAWLRRGPLYDDVAILASAALLFGAIWFLRWKPTWAFAPLRLVGFAAFAQAFIGSGLSVIQRVELTELVFTPAPGAFSFAVVSSFLFTSMFVLGIVGAMLLVRQQAEPETEGYLPDWLAWTLACAAAAYGLATAFRLPLLGKLGTAPTIAFKLSLVLGLLTATQLLQKRSMKLPLALVFGAQLIGVITTSMLGAILLPVRDVTLTFIHLGKRFPFRLTILAGLLLLALNPAKHAVRGEFIREHGDAPYAFDSTERAVGVWRDALVRTWSPESRNSVDAGRHLQTTFSRLDYNWAAALIYTMVPGTLPFEQGRTYEDVPTVLIPRVLYPNKPGSSDYFRTRWTVKLGIQTWESAKRTAIAIPAFGEAYWNFGWLGVALVPLPLGLLVGILIYLAPSHPVGRTGYVIVIATSLTSFIDMLIWQIPQIIVVLVTAVLVRIYVRAVPKRAAPLRFAGSGARARRG